MPAETNPPAAPSAWQLLVEAEFTVGGEDRLDAMRTKHVQPPNDENAWKTVEDDWQLVLAKIQVQVGTLLKTDSVSFLLGAGASKHCGGVLMGAVPTLVEIGLVESGISNGPRPRIAKWLQCFYLGASHTPGASGDIPVTREDILARRDELNRPRPTSLAVNYEALLSTLWRWRSALPEAGGAARLEGNPRVSLASDVLDECLRRATEELASACHLPTRDRVDGLAAYQELLRKVLARPLSLKRANFFTLNYDTLLEQASDTEGAILIDGFAGTLTRVFRPECYDQDLYFPAQTTEGPVRRLDRVTHLFKLHGSITWRTCEPGWDNPYGVSSTSQRLSPGGKPLIFPTPAKFGETLGMPYAELFRRFAATIVRPQSTLVVVGYGFGDSHVNSIVRQALTVPSFTLVVVDPRPASAFVQQLLQRHDRRIWLFSGNTLGTFEGFARYVLPDLRDQEMRRRVEETFRGLGESEPLRSPSAVA